MLHTENLPEQDCDGELIELPEDKPTYVHFAQCVRCGTEFTFVPDSDWVRALIRLRNRGLGLGFNLLLSIDGHDAARFGVDQC